VDVDALLDNVIGSYQHVWLERDGLKARVEELEQEIANTKELEKLLRDGLASAQRAAEQVKQEAEQQVSGLVEEARARADELLTDAEAKAEAIVAESRERRDRLHEETTRLEQANHDVRERYRAFLLEALSVVEATAEHKAVEPEPVAAADESAPVAEEEEGLQAPVGWLAPRGGRGGRAGERDARRGEPRRRGVHDLPRHAGAEGRGGPARGAGARGRRGPGEDAYEDWSPKKP
jgi:cell division initiation protein